MLVYLFRQRSNADLALTSDVTGRNLPPSPITLDLRKVARNQKALGGHRRL